MDDREQIIESIKESLNHSLGEAITPEMKELLKQQINQILFNALAEGKIIRTEEIHIYSHGDSLCKRCGYDLYGHKDPTMVDISIGHPKRPEYCDRCQQIQNEIQEIMNNEV